ncbi:MAG: PA14 domain-containing protein [Planctomycetota bacterium]
MKRYSLTVLSAVLGVVLLTAPAGARTTVTVENSRMVVTAYIAFQGASTETVDRWVKEIQDVWNGPKGSQAYGECGHRVVFVVVSKIVPAGEKFPRGYHRVEVKPYDGTQASLPQTPDGQVAIAYMGKTTHSPSQAGASIDGVWSTRSSAPVNPRHPGGERFKDAAHETGHMMGLPDYYSRKTKWQARNLMGRTEGRWSVPTPPLISGIIEAVTGKCYCLCCPPPAERPALRPAGDGDLQPGLSYRLCDGKFTTLPDFGSTKAAKAGLTQGLDLAVAAGKGAYAVMFSGYIEVPKDGCYTFFLRSNDGARLKVGGKVLAGNDQTRGLSTQRGMVNLKAGKHAIEVAYLTAGKPALELRYDGAGVSRQLVPDTAYFCRPVPASPTAQADGPSR